MVWDDGSLASGVATVRLTKGSAILKRPFNDDIDLAEKYHRAIPLAHEQAKAMGLHTGWNFDWLRIIGVDGDAFLGSPNDGGVLVAAAAG